MFKKTPDNPQYDMFSTPSTQLGKREAKKYDDPGAWHNRFYSKRDVSNRRNPIFPFVQAGQYGCPQRIDTGNYRHVHYQGRLRLQR